MTMKIAVLCFFVFSVLTISTGASATDSRSDLFCNLALKHFASSLPPAPSRQVHSGMCKLGSPEKGEVDVYFPTLGTDSLERERIVTVSIGSRPVDEPELGGKAFSVHHTNLDTQKRTFYIVQYYARRDAQIFSITFKRYRPFVPADFAADRKAIKAFFDELD
jgi:hypothetical protein